LIKGRPVGNSSFYFRINLPENFFNFHCRAAY
jgi:hypothetical protein